MYLPESIREYVYVKDDNREDGGMHRYSGRSYFGTNKNVSVSDTWIVIYTILS